MRLRVIILPMALATYLFSLTIEEAVKDAVTTHPQVLESIKLYREIRQDVEISKAGYKPTLDYIGGAGRERTKSAATSNRWKYLNRYDNRLTLNQNLFSGFYTTNDIEQNSARTASAAYGVLDKANKIALETAKSYVEVLKQYTILSLSDEGVKIHEDTFDKIKERTDSGLGKNSDVQQTEARLMLAKANYVAQQNNYYDSLTRAHKALGRHIQIDELSHPVFNAALPSSIDKATAVAVQNHPAMKSSMSTINAQRSNYMKNKSNYYPKIDGELFGSINKNVSGVAGKNEDSGAKLNLTYNLYNGGADEALQQQTLSRLHKEHENSYLQRRNIIELTRLSYTAYEMLTSQLKYLTRHVASSKETLDSYNEEYNLGRRDLLDLLSAQEEYISARKSKATAEYDLILAKYRILDAMGILTRSMNINIETQVGISPPATISEDMYEIYSKYNNNQEFLREAEEGALKLYDEVDSKTLNVEMDTQIDTHAFNSERDKDGRFDIADLCDNSKQTNLVNMFGCREIEQKLDLKKPEKNEPQQELLLEEDEPILEKTAFDLNKKTQTLSLNNIYFAFDKSNLTPQSINIINSLADQLIGINEYKLKIFAHTDSLGSDAYNENLSYSRANSVKNSMVAQGVPSQNIEIFGLSERFPIAENSTTEGRAKNRRIEFQLIQENVKNVANGQKIMRSYAEESDYIIPETTRGNSYVADSSGSGLMDLPKYSYQVGTYRFKESALSALNSMPLSIKSESFIRKIGQYYTLRYGKYDSRNALEERAHILKDAGIDSFFVAKTLN